MYDIILCIFSGGCHYWRNIFILIMLINIILRDMGNNKKENFCSICGVVIEEGLDHCDSCRNKYRS